jgi:hypothetical protein
MCLNIVEDIKIRRLGWGGHIIRIEEEDPIKGFKWNLPQHKTSGKTNNQMGRCGSEGCIIAARSKRMEKNRKQRRVEARFGRGQGPKGAVATYMDGRMDGWMPM